MPQEDQNPDGEEKAPAEQANGETTPTPATGGATTRQRSGKATPAKPQQPKLAPRPISKAKKSKKGKGKGAAAKKTLMTLHGYWRSGCSWRVRLALGLKSFALGKEIDFVPVHLVKEGGEQKTEAYSKLNPAQVSSFLCFWLERRAMIASFTAKSLWANLRVRPTSSNLLPLLYLDGAHLDRQGQEHHQEASHSHRVNGHLRVPRRGLSKQEKVAA